MTKEKSRQFPSGDHKPFRDDLVAWPTTATVEGEGPVAALPSPEPEIVVPKQDEVHGELVRAKAEVRRLLARIQELVEENGELRRAAQRHSRR